VSLERLAAYAEAGADCLYAPGVSDPQEIEAMVKAVSPKPVNVLALRPASNFAVAKLADLGVRRISVGSLLSRVAWTAFIKAAESIATTGTFETFDTIVFTDLNKIFSESA
jgi:2-methylisocitrate lyase-like PEP mutase family enzyme